MFASFLRRSLKNVTEDAVGGARRSSAAFAAISTLSPLLKTASGGSGDGGGGGGGDGPGSEDAKAKFREVYRRLKAELLDDPAFESTPESRQWISKLRVSTPADAGL